MSWYVVINMICRWSYQSKYMLKLETRNMVGHGNRNKLNIWLLLKYYYLLIVKKGHKHHEQDLYLILIFKLLLMTNDMTPWMHYGVKIIWRLIIFCCVINWRNITLSSVEDQTTLRKEKIIPSMHTDWIRSCI